MVQMAKGLGSKHGDLNPISSINTRHISSCNPRTGEAETRVSSQLAPVSARDPVSKTRLR